MSPLAGLRLTGPVSLLLPTQAQGATLALRLTSPEASLLRRQDTPGAAANSGAGRRGRPQGEAVVPLLSWKPASAPLLPPPLSLPSLQPARMLPMPVTSPAPAVPSLPLPEVPAEQAIRLRPRNFGEAAQRWVLQDRRKTMAPTGLPFPLEIKASAISAALTLKGRF